MNREDSRKIEGYLKTACDKIWYANQIFKKEGVRNVYEVLDEVIEKLLAARFYTITLEKKEKE